MAENSGIEWTHHTFNPWIGCTKVSAACDNCYAEAWDKRFGGERWGPHSPRQRTSPANWQKPIKWNREAAAKGVRYRVFCASLADVFDNHGSITSGWRGDLWHLIARTPHLDWLLLTKRPQNIKKMLPDSYGAPAWGGGWPNVWLGTTIEDQTEADRRIPHLVKVPAVVHFLSMEPLQGSVDLRSVRHGHASAINYLEWIIVGGESGHQYREAKAEWFRSLRDQCKEAGIPFLFKQWSGRSQKEIKAKGRALDGVVHDGYPAPRGSEPVNSGVRSC